MKILILFVSFVLLLPVPLEAAMTGGNFEIYADTFSVVQDNLSTTGGDFTLTNSGGEASGVLGRTATGTIYNPLIGGILNGGQIVLSDGATVTTFTFRNRAGAATGNIESGTVTIDTGGGGGGVVGTMTDRIAQAINHANARLEIDAVSDGVNTVTLVNTRTSGTDGNVTITETVGDASFVVTGMSGGGNISSGVVLSGGFQAMERASLSMSLSTNTLGLGTLSLSSVSSASLDINVTTDSVTGYAVTLTEDGNLRKGAGGVNDEIEDVSDGSVTAGSEEYGLLTTGVAGLLAVDTAISGNLSVVSYNTSITNQITTFTFHAAIGNSSRAGSYSHTVTLSATANP